jgi:hypothetical protein
MVACSTYDASLLVVSLDPSQAGGGSAATSGAGASGADSAGSTSGSNSDAGFAAVNAGTAGAGTGGNSGTAGGGSPGGGSAGASGGGAMGGTSGAAGAAGSAGTSGSAGALAGAGGAGAPQYELIDDFEDQDLILSYLSSLPAAQRRNGTWYPIQDATLTGISGPALVIAPLVGDTREGFALHFTASGFMDWGAGLGADFKKAGTVTNPYDVSAYKGIHFYAKVAAGSQTALKVLIPTTSTDAHGLKCMDTVLNKHCGDHFLCQINSIKTSWAAYECDFVDLHQQLIPGDLVATFDPTAVYSVQLSLVTKTLGADLWLDDVSFVLK